MRHTILLSVDGSLLVEIDSPDRAYAAFRNGDDYAPLEIPSDAHEVNVVGPGGRGPYFFRPAVTDALRDLAHAGVDIVWNTRWLTAPELLERLATELRLDEAVRLPTPAELPDPPVNVRIDHEPNVFWENWKVRALVQRVRDLSEDVDLVLVDADLDYTSRRLFDGVARRARRESPRVGGIKTEDRLGLGDREVAALWSWIASGELPRI